MSGGPPRLTLVLVAWDSAALLPSSIGSFHRSAAAAGAAVEVVVVDNASSDLSAEVARSLGADRVVVNPLNVGFVAAASQGLALAAADWVLLANPDLVVTEPFVATVLAAISAAPADVAAIVPDVRFASDSEVVNSRGLEVDELGIPAEREFGRRAAAAPAGEVFGPSSSASVLRLEALRRIGGLEPAYFAYLEDVDVAWRLRKAGYRALFVPEAVAVHEGSASTGEGSWLKVFLVGRNRRILFRMHGPRSARARALRSVTDAGHTVVQVVSGSRGAAIRGRAAAVHSRRYGAFLRASNLAIGVEECAEVALAPRFTLLDSLRRKRAATTLMRRAAPEGANGRARPSAAGGEPVRVLVDAANLKPGQGGIRTYTLGLVHALAREPRLRLTVATSVPEEFEGVGVEVVGLPSSTRSALGRAVWRDRRLPALARGAAADVLLAPVPELPLRGLAIPSVVVVHDVGPLVAPAFYSADKRLRQQTMLRFVCRRASRLVCVTHSTLVGLRATTGVDPARCDVIGEGPQPLPAPGEELSAEGFVLCVGALDRRKNVETLLDAVLDADPPLPRLVLCGPATGPELAALRRRCARAPRRVEHLGFVTPEELARLYRNCLAVALPSLYEGFGLPLLEAFEAEAPVVASDIPTVREVGGSATLRVERPLDPGCWQDALRRLAADAELRERLRAEGRLALERHSWGEVGSRFSEVLVRAAGRDSVLRLAAATPAPRAAE